MLNKRWMLITGLILLAAVALAACQPAEGETVVVTVIVPETGEVQVVEAEEPAEEGPMLADGMVECLPLPEMAYTMGTSLAAPAVPAPADAPSAFFGERTYGPIEQAGDVYRVGVFEDITTSNFWGANGPDNTVWNSYMLPDYPTLFTLSDQQFTIVPDIAAVNEPPEMVEEGGMFMFDIPIRQDVFWSDGEQLTADDLVFTQNTILDLGLISGNFQTWADGNYLDHLEAVDDFTVRMVYHTRPGLARHEYGALQSPILPEHFWTPLMVDAGVMAPVEALGDSPAEEDLAAAQAEAHDLLFSIVPEGEPSAGAFVFSRWEPGAFIENTTHPNFYNQGVTITQYTNGAYEDTTGTVVGEVGGDVSLVIDVGPHVSSVIYYYYGSQDAALLALRDGEIDFMINPLGMQRGLQDQAEADPNVEVLANPTNGFRYLSFNNRRRPMNDCSFRQAVAVLIDKEYVTQTILQGVAFPLYTYVPEANAFWFYDEVPMLGQGLGRGERIALAVQILQNAGYTWEGGLPPSWNEDGGHVDPGGNLIMPDGVPVPPLDLYGPAASYDPLRATFAVWIETWMREAGIPVTAHMAGFNVIVPIIFTEQSFDMYILGWSLGVFPSYLRDFFSEEQAVVDGNNAGGYISPEFEELSANMLTCTTQDECLEIANSIQLLLATETPYVVLFDTGILEPYAPANIDFPYTEHLSGLQYVHQTGGPMQSYVTIR